MKKKFKKEAGRAMTSHSLQMSSSHDSLQWNMCPVMWAFTPTGVLKQKKKCNPLPYSRFRNWKEICFSWHLPKSKPHLGWKMNSADFKDFLISQELVLLRHNFHFICRKIYIYLNYPIIFVHPIIKEVHKGKMKKTKTKRRRLLFDPKRDALFSCVKR